MISCNYYYDNHAAFVVFIISLNTWLENYESYTFTENIEYRPTNI